MKITPETWQSILAGVRALRQWYNLFGVLAASVAISNFLFALLNLAPAVIIRELFFAYVFVFHGVIDLALFPFGLSLPGWTKDLLFLYAVLGGSFMRARASEGIYSDGSLKRAWYTLRTGKSAAGGLFLGSRLSSVWKESPRWLQRVLDFVLWPRVARQYFQQPMVYLHHYHGTHQTFAAGYKPGGWKTFLDDRRLVFLVQFCAVIIAVVALSVTSFSISGITG